MFRVATNLTTKSLLRQSTTIKHQLRFKSGGKYIPKLMKYKNFLASAFVCTLIYIGMEYYKEQKQAESSVDIKQFGRPALGGPWLLFDQNGKPVTNESFPGKFQLVYFGFTYCPDICPSELVKVGKVMKILEKKGYKDILKPIFISVDPVRDTIGQMKYYSNDFDDEWSFLTGTAEQIHSATRAYRVYFSKADEHESDDEDYLVDHSIVLYLMSPDQEFLEFYTQRIEASEISEKIIKQIKDFKKV